MTFFDRVLYIEIFITFRSKSSPHGTRCRSQTFVDTVNWNFEERRSSSHLDDRHRKVLAVSHSASDAAARIIGFLQPGSCDLPSRITWRQCHVYYSAAPSSCSLSHCCFRIRRVRLRSCRFSDQDLDYELLVFIPNQLLVLPVAGGRPFRILSRMFDSVLHTFLFGPCCSL
jgi:hypothetical protein